MRSLRCAAVLAGLSVLSMSALAQEGTEVGDVIINTSINVEIDSGESVFAGTIIQPREGDDVDLLITAEMPDGQFFDPVMIVWDFDSSILATNDDWRSPEGDQQGTIHDVIACYVAAGAITPQEADAVVLLSLERVPDNQRRSVLVEVGGFQGDAGQVIVSFLQVDGALAAENDCADI